MTALLPDGWETFPPEAKRRLLETLRAVQENPPRPWYCPNPSCDGTPHAGVGVPHARAEQRPPPGEWGTWLISAGRGAGKTRTGAEWSWRQARRYPRGALVGPTAGDVRDILVEGESGVLACAPATFRPHYEPSKRRLTYPNGAIQTTYSAEEPDRLRGPQHHYAWGDEFATWKSGGDNGSALDNLLLGLRLGDDPRALLTTTPRPTAAMRAVMEDPATVLVRGSTYDNLGNLAEPFRRRILARYEGTRLGAQELHGEVLEDVEGALWDSAMLAAARGHSMPDPGELSAIVVAIDPAVTANADSDETGIVVVGVSGPVDARLLWVLEDVSGTYSPDGWARVALDAHERWGAGAVVAEVNNGGDMVGQVLRQQPGGRAIRYRPVRATRGKRVRAEPVAALYEQRRARHAPGLTELEEQMRTWTVDSGVSPDRMDALVWGATHLLGFRQGRVTGG